MNEVRIIGEIEGFDRVIYESSANWNNFSLSIINNGKAKFETWLSEINTPEEVSDAITLLSAQLQRFLLSVEWQYGHELKCNIEKILEPPFYSGSVLRDKLTVRDHPIIEVKPRKAPQDIPQIPLEAERWVRIWVECSRFRGYVEERLRRHYLLIEELWQELHHIFNASQRAEKKEIKLIRDFVSHASCDNPDVIVLIESSLPSAVEMVSGKKQVRFQRTDEHRNYIARFETKSSEMARSLVDKKMLQFGIVSRV